MAQKKTTVSRRPRSGHAAIEGSLSTPILQFELRKEIQQLLRQESWQRSAGRSSKTLVKHPDLRIVLVLMKAKTKMSEHKAPARISIQTITGHIRLHLPDGTVELPAGHLVALDECLPHDVEAKKQSAFLLTMSWPPAAESK